MSTTPRGCVAVTNWATKNGYCGPHVSWAHSLGQPIANYVLTGHRWDENLYIIDHSVVLAFFSSDVGDPFSKQKFIWFFRDFRNIWNNLNSKVENVFF